MAARKKTPNANHIVQPKQIAVVIIAMGTLSVVANNFSTFATFSVILAGLAAALWFFRKKLRKSARQKLFLKLDDAIEQHQNALISYYNQSRSEDLFGNRNDARWHDRIDTFLRSQIVPNVSHFSTWKQSEIGAQTFARVHSKTAEKVALLRADNPLANIDATNLTPIEYEHHCAELLKAKGWAVRMTPATRDGGADFIAEKHNWRMVVQCKRYASPVGNKAVQEVNSAVRLYNGNVACVVAPTGFTRQAQFEANSLSVKLMHHSDLPLFAEQFSETPFDPALPPNAVE